MTLGRLLADTAARFPERVALAFEGTRLSYAELDGLAEAARPDARVLPLPLPNVPESVARFHGALRHGAVAVPLNPLLSDSEVQQRRQHFEPRPETAVVLFTSGTTGEPKRVELSHALLRANAEYLAHDALALTEQDVLFGSAPLSHVFGMTACMNASIAAGASLALVRRFDARDALATIEREGVTVFMGVPAMLAGLLAASDETGRAPHMRLAHCGGAPLPLDTARAFEERFGCAVLEGYGMTEVGGVAATNHAGRRRKPGSVGEAAAGQELRIAADGEVLVRVEGRSIATGDIGRLDEDGHLFLLDRKKDVILRGGYTVYPREVEEALVAHPAVREAVVVGVPHPTLGEEVAALVVAAGCTPDELTAFVRERVAAYKYPRVVSIVDDLPRGPSGKILRRAIDRQALAARANRD
ncbi:MAG TPA: AMP-binding protein [Gaiellaceae bacterium]|nr:AMP-binding protein [Gaiellaceae bacterium]